jgi:hypothetical protein
VLTKTPQLAITDFDAILVTVVADFNQGDREPFRYMVCFKAGKNGLRRFLITAMTGLDNLFDGFWGHLDSCLGKGY